MMHETKEEHFDKMWRLAKELRDYKRKHKWELVQKLILVACIIMLIAAMVIGIDDVIRSALHRLFSSSKSLTK